MNTKIKLFLSTMLVFSLLGCSQNGEKNPTSKDKDLAESTEKLPVESEREYFMEGNYQALYGADTDFNSLFTASDLVFLATVNEKKESFPATPGTDILKTNYSITILENFKGNTQGTTDIMMPGGEMLMSDYVKQMNPGEYEKRGYSSLTEADLAKYVKVNPTNYVELEVGKTYVFLTAFDSQNSIIYVACDGYGIYEYNEVDQTITNSLNNETINLDSIRN